MPLAVQILQLAVVSIDPKYFATQCNCGGEDVVGDVDEDGGGNEEPSKLREEKAGRIAHLGVFIFVIAIRLTKVQPDVVCRVKICRDRHDRRLCKFFPVV